MGDNRSIKKYIPSEMVKKKVKEIKTDNLQFTYPGFLRKNK
jgi:hypothetical protein